MQGQGSQWAACWPLLPHELRKPSILLNVVLPPSIRAFSTRVARKEGQSLSARSLLSPTYPWLSFIPQGRIPLHFSIMSSGPSEAPGGQVQCPEMWALIHIWSRVEHSVWMRPLRDPEKVDKNSDWYIPTNICSHWLWGQFCKNWHPPPKKKIDKLKINSICMRWALTICKLPCWVLWEENNVQDFILGLRLWRKDCGFRQTWIWISALLLDALWVWTKYFNFLSPGFLGMIIVLALQDCYKIEMK